MWHDDHDETSRNGCTWCLCSTQILQGIPKKVTIVGPPRVHYMASSPREQLPAGRTKQAPRSNQWSKNCWLPVVSNVFIYFCFWYVDMKVSWNGDTPKSSILIGFSIGKQPYWGSSIFGNPHIDPLMREQQIKPGQPSSLLRDQPVLSGLRDFA